MEANLHRLDLARAAETAFARPAGSNQTEDNCFNVQNVARTNRGAPTGGGARGPSLCEVLCGDWGGRRGAGRPK